MFTFVEVAETVESQFFDSAMNDIDWANHVAACRRHIDPGMDMDAFADVTNEMLNALNASRTQLFVRDSSQRCQLAGLFLPSHGAPAYVGVRGFVGRRADGDFVIGVLDWHLAAAAGVKMGDRIASVEGLPFYPIRSFETRVGPSTRLLVKRNVGRMMSLDVTPSCSTDAQCFKTPCAQLFNGSNITKPRLVTSMHGHTPINTTMIS